MIRSTRRHLFLSVIIIGSVALAAIGVIILRGVQRPQNPAPSKAEEGWKQFDDNAAGITYNQSGCWYVQNTSAARGGTYHQSAHNSKAYPNCGAFTDQWVKLDPGTSFDQIKVGYGSWRYGAQIIIKVAGEQVGQVDTFSGATGAKRQTKEWISSNLTCSSGPVETRITGGQAGPPSVLDLDYIDIHECTGDGGDGGDSAVCQGNKDAPAKCFDCKKDATSASQVNILDFACFTKYYGEDVGKP